MTLIQSWIDSVQLLRPKNLKLFAMVTLKSIIEAYKLMLKYWWWACVLAIGCLVLMVYSSHLDTVYYANIGFRWLYQLLFFATCLATRPSVEQKNCAYFRSHMFAFVYMAIFLAIAPLIMWPAALSCWHIFLMLFFLDSDGGPKNFFFSMWYALKMIIFNYPLLAVISFILYVPAYFFTLAYNNAMIDSVTSTILMPIGICTYANIYIKKLHDQFDLYVKQPQ